MNEPRVHPALQISGLGVHYGALTALDDMSWSVDDSEILGIIGPNGAGKSSCFAALTNSVRHHGDVFLDGISVTDLPTHQLARRGLRRTFQQNSFFGDLTVLENMTSAIVVHRSTGLARSLVMPWSESATRRRTEDAAAELLMRFGIASDYYLRLPSEIPYGAQRLLSIALAHGEFPKVLLLDEPAAGIGGADMHNLIDLLRTLRRPGLALVVIEHHMDLIMSVADRIVVIESGRLLADGTPDEIAGNDAVIEAYLGRTQ